LLSSYYEKGTVIAIANNPAMKNPNPNLCVTNLHFIHAIWAFFIVLRNYKLIDFAIGEYSYAKEILDHHPVYFFRVLKIMN